MVIDIDIFVILFVREFVVGMVEVIKYGIIYDVLFFEWFESNVDVFMLFDIEIFI